MADKNLVILSDPPAYFVANGPDAFGSLDFEPLQTAHSLAIKAYKRSDELPDDPDTVESLRAAVNALSDAVSALTGQLMQIHTGVRSGRIAVEYQEEF